MPDAKIEVKKKAAPAPTAMTEAWRASVPESWRSLRTEMDQLFDRFAGALGMPSLRRMFDIDVPWRFETAFNFSMPAVDMNEDEKSYKISAELPGMDEKDIEVVLSGDTLTIKGEKSQEREDKGKNHFLAERCYGAFQRSFLLPEGVDRDKIDAKFTKGVLTVALPKSAEALKAKKKIEVKAA